MPMIKLCYCAQLAQAAGTREETIDLADKLMLIALLAEIAAKHSPRFRALIFDTEGKIRSTLLVCVDNAQVLDCAQFELQAHHREVLLLTPMSGG